MNTIINLFNQANISIFDDTQACFTINNVAITMNVGDGPECVEWAFLNNDTTDFEELDDIEKQEFQATATLLESTITKLLQTKEKLEDLGFYFEFDNNYWYFEGMGEEMEGKGFAYEAIFEATKHLKNLNSFYTKLGAI